MEKLADNHVSSHQPSKEGGINYGDRDENISTCTDTFASGSAPSGQQAIPTLEVQGGESISKPIAVDKAQTLTILAQAIKFPDNGGGHGTYSIQVNGPVTLIR